jgi:amino acid transporter
MPRLQRVLGLGDVTLFFVVAVVGVRWIATAAAAGPSALTVWLIVFVAMFLPLAFTVVELSSRHPDEGGLYVWTRRAFGDFTGFIAAFFYWVSNLVYFPGLLYFGAGNALYAFGERGAALANSPAYFVTVSLAGLALVHVLNVRGLSTGTRLNNAGAWATWIPIAGLVVLGAIAWARFGSATSFAPGQLVPSARLTDMVFWSTIAFGFGGLEAASFMGGEIRDARRTVPLAIVFGGLTVTAIYVLGTLAVLIAVPAGDVSGLEGIMQAIARVAERAGAPGLTPLFAGLIAFSCLGGVGAWLASVARIPFVCGVDRILPPAFGKLHPRYGTPHVALLAQTIGAAIVTVLGQAGATVQGAYDVLVSMGVITYFVPFLCMFAAMIKLQREPAPAGVLRVPGGRPVAVALAALGFATTAFSIVLACIPSPGTPNPALVVVKIVGGSFAVFVIAVVLYRRARGRTA